MSEIKFGRIGGTTVAAIVGVSPWLSPLGAYLQLRREVGPTPDNVYMERGRRYEPIVADCYQGAHTDVVVAHNRERTEEPELYVHPEHDFLIGHPDRLLYDADTNELSAGLEIKTTNWSNARQWGEEGTDQIPDNYLVQCQWYAGLAGLKRWDVAVAFLDDNGRMRQYKEYTVRADAELFSSLVDSAVEFWNENVLAGNPPECSGVDETTAQWLAQRYPRNIDPMDSATKDEENLMENYLLAKEALNEAQKSVESAEAALKLAIGARDGLTSEAFGKVTWKCSKDSSRVDYKALCSELSPSDELIAKHTKTVAGTRRFVTTGLHMNN